MNTLIIFLSLIFTFFSCSLRNDKNTNKKITTKDSISKTNPRKHISIDDSLFVFKGIENTECIEHCKWDFNKFFVDSTKKIAYVNLDNKTKVILLPEITGMDTIWVKEGMDAFFVSKQERIGKVQPIIIKVTGTDYTSLILVTTNESGYILSSKILFGGENGGPLNVSDSLLILPPFSRSYFNKNEIKTFSITASINPNKNNIPAIIDSVNYLTTIDENGNIKTIETDSTRYKRIYKW
jgi:hypothetical protein